MMKLSIRVKYETFGIRPPKANRYTIRVSIEAVAVPICGPMFDESILNTAQDMPTIRNRENITFQTQHPVCPATSISYATLCSPHSAALNVTGWILPDPIFQSAMKSIDRRCSC